MSEVKNKKWSDEAVAALTGAANRENPVSAASVRSLAAQLSVTERSVAAKLRQLGHAVASMATVKAPTFSEAQTAALQSFVSANEGKMTYKEIAEQFDNGAFNAKQIQGKLLALELSGAVKPTEKVEAVRTYTEAEETKFISLANAGKFIEEIAEALNKSIASVRGKALSLTRSGTLTTIPAQKESHAKNDVDPVDALGEKLATMTVADIATATGKTERGIKTLLTRRGIKVVDHDGAAKKEKAEGKRATAAA